ncbi:NmrA family NAD(P)-binding protein [Rhodococcus sp. D2-41]|uniref:Saccharopine dehydrogenase NADP-binding domain-containing protein n=1 Tax=Speluncibacter jeojiensis TaxID=2710754 RepID=A0A9X4M0D8_9ACTN|nr:saccharopine dehydrogenase NADP-binding domain-containing protein [Rhodococcus sp. D2-41]MDG3009758.1 NmrA family NAD(P)-binding protein [Rhodococcus sp. D2-41]MDG3014507.1 saccharopine dehydrogenase NADP-binding domain-containing protein [Corynebacteriales bacterium D3-21]
MKLVILSAGSIAAAAARLLAPTGSYDELVIADIDLDKASTLANELGGKAVHFDATDPASIRSAITGADVVFNAVGPFYRFGMPIIRAAVDCGVNYVDVCDEFDVAEQLVRATDLDEAAKTAGVSVIFGMGYAPGITSLIGRWAAESLDSAHSVDVTMAIPYMVNMGATINEHMLHSMSGDVRQFIDGEIRSVPAWGGPRPTTFGAPFDTTVDAGYMGHPEGITLGTYVPGLLNATVRYTWFEQAGNEMWQLFEKLGLTDPNEIEGLPISPRQFLARFMATAEGERGLAVESSRMPGTVMQIVAEGEIGGEPARAQFETQIVYTGGLSHDPTPRAAAAAVRAVLEGRVTRKGLMSPEACFDPEPFVTGVLQECGITLTKQITTTTKIN